MKVQPPLAIGDIIPQFNIEKRNIEQAPGRDPGRIQMVAAASTRAVEDAGVHKVREPDPGVCHKTLKPCFQASGQRLPNWDNDDDADQVLLLELLGAFNTHLQLDSSVSSVHNVLRNTLH